MKQAGCLDRCDEGMVVYPEGVWNTCVDKEDVDAIIRSHIQDGCPVERLRIQRTSFGAGAGRFGAPAPCGLQNLGSQR